MFRQYGTFFALALMNAAVSVQLAAPAEARMPGGYEWGIWDGPSHDCVKRDWHMHEGIGFDPENWTIPERPPEQRKIWPKLSCNWDEPEHFNGPLPRMTRPEPDWPWMLPDGTEREEPPFWEDDPEDSEPLFELDVLDVSSTVGVERPVAAKAVDLAVQEWEHWGRQTLRSNRRVKRQKGTPKIHFEKDSGYAERVGEFWAVVNNEKWTGKTNEPWSAAFVSWVMQEAGAGKAFRYSGAHSVYIRAAIANRKAGKLDAGFVGYRVEEMAPRLGDLVCYSREKSHTSPYDSVKHYSSHCDVVVATDEDEIEVIGGNVRDSVSKKILAVDREGLVADQETCCEIKRY